jgi:hypothetical protein
MKLTQRSFRPLAIIAITSISYLTLLVQPISAKSDANRSQQPEPEKKGKSKEEPREEAKEDGKNERENKDGSYSFAVIGDVPYGAVQIAQFPKVIAQINGDPDVRLVTHVGDIKSGSSVCSDAYFSQIRTNFDTFADPLVYTPGDNEWTDCHRTNNGSYNPIERLGAIRKVFFPTPGQTLGQKKMNVKSQASLGFPENVRFEKGDVSFVSVNIPGSNNSLVNWTGKTAPTAEQLAESQTRTAASIQLVNETFTHAREEHSRAVVIILQADMFDPTLPCPAGKIAPCPPVFAEWNGFQTFVQNMAAQSAAFNGPVYLFNGDSHVFNVDKPLATGTAWAPIYGTGNWLSFYGVTTPANNLTRITGDGSTALNNWLKVTINEDDPAVLSWTKVPFSG